MAVYFAGLAEREDVRAHPCDGRQRRTIDLSSLGRPVADKHSTAVSATRPRSRSACSSPPAAAVREDERPRPRPHRRHPRQARVIPGYRLELPTEEFVPQLRDIGLVITGQCADLVPADRRLYALRDVTATVHNFPLIAASIMSKKLAAGANVIVLDVKVGDGAFMKTIEDGRALAEAMIELGRSRRPRGRLHAHRHGPAARAGGRERAARAARGAGDDPRGGS